MSVNMTKKIATNPIWIPIADAVIRLRGQYEHAGIYASKQDCFQAAKDTLLRRLRKGQLSGRAAGFSWVKKPKAGYARKVDADGFIAVPTAFWAALCHWNESDQGDDWIAGDFELYFANGYEQHRGHVIGLEVREDQLPRDLDPAITSQVSSAQPIITEAKAGGRSAAKWWPDFAEELALFIHEEGVPPGSGHDGQSEVLDKICKRLTAASKEEPGRATVQPVINAVLERIRSAGN